jgi:REP element-mobilizing transposase RayT
MSKLLTRKSGNRLEGYDYSQSNYYYVTICTDNREERFGKIENNKMSLNYHGQIVKQQWQWLAKQYSYIELDEYVVMPNHIHGILIINNSIRTGHDLSLQHRIKSLSSLIGAFKTTSSKLIHQNGLFDFAWQRSFYDHIIRNDESLDKMREYISNNPLKWDDDENNIKSNKLMGQACMTPTE